MAIVSRKLFLYSSGNSLSSLTTSQYFQAPNNLPTMTSSNPPYIPPPLLVIFPKTEVPPPPPFHPVEVPPPSGPPQFGWPGETPPPLPLKGPFQPWPRDI